MKVAAKVYRLANRALDRVGLTLVSASRDFDCRLTDEESERRVTEGLAKLVNEWLERQTLFEVRAFVTGDDAHRFYRAYLASPFRSRFGGSRFNNLFALYAVAKAYDPEIILDSGTYEGASAWALRSGCPSANLLSFDIDLKRLLQRSEGVTYVERDWAEYIRPGDPLTKKKILAYFDDHVDQARRLLEAGERSVEVAIFDDDFPVTSFAEMAHGGAALPKIEFVLDDDLRSTDVLRWTANGRDHEWMVNAAYLDRARAAILDTDRMPQTAFVTGIHQTPYRVVRLRSASPTPAPVPALSE